MSLIERDDAIELVSYGIELCNKALDSLTLGGRDKYAVETERNSLLKLKDDLKMLPTVQERKGKWIERNPQNSDKCRLIECDQCGFAHIVGFNVPYEDWIENRNFCERCGADMRGEGEQE